LEDDSAVELVVPEVDGYAERSVVRALDVEGHDLLFVFAAFVGVCAGLRKVLRR
jgi:hypothetical protein